MAFPEHCLRGIPNQGFLLDGGPDVTQDLFYYNLKGDRGDGWVETSVSWRDNDEAVDITLGLTKDDGSIKFLVGLAVLPTEKLEHAQRLPSRPDSLHYERSPEPDNEYHGNILFNAELDVKIIRMVASTLALAVTEVIPQQAP